MVQPLWNWPIRLWARDRQGIVTTRVDDDSGRNLLHQIVAEQESEHLVTKASARLAVRLPGDNQDIADAQVVGATVGGDHDLLELALGGAGRIRGGRGACSGGCHGDATQIVVKNLFPRPRLRRSVIANRALDRRPTRSLANPRHPTGQLAGAKRKVRFNIS